MTTLADLHSDIASAIGRGSSLDDRIPGWVTEAVNLLEMNSPARGFIWMRQRGEVTMDHTADVPYRCDLPNDRVKEIISIRPKRTGNGRAVTFGAPLVGVDESQITAFDVDVPQGFFWDLSGIYFDAWSDSEDLSFAMEWAEYTEWPTSPSASPTILARGYAALKGEALMAAARDLRDPRFKQWEADRDRAITIMTDAENRAVWGHRRGLRMNPVDLRG